MDRKLIEWIGLTGLVAFISYAAAVLIAPTAYPGYDWMSQAVSDLSAEGAPSRTLWNQIAALYNVCSVVCVTCVSIYVSQENVWSKRFRTGIHLFTVMCWVSAVGYAMFPLTASGSGTGSFQDTMHIVVTALVVILSIVSLLILIIEGFKNKDVKGIGIWAAIAFLMMLVGAIGQGVVPPEFFGVFERFSVFAAVGFTAVLGAYLFTGFGRGVQE